MIVRQLKNAYDYYGKGGWAEVALRLSQRALLPSWLFLFTEDVVVRLNRLNERSLARTPEGYVYSQADRSVLEELLACSGEFDRTVLRGAFERFFDEGNRCFTVRQSGQVVGYMWAFEKRYVLTYDNYKSRNIAIALDDKSVFLGNGLIDTSHRLKGLFQHLMAFIIAQWPDGTQFYSAIERTNDRSLRSHLRLGFVEHLGILCASVCGMTRYFRCNVAEERARINPAHGPLML